MKINSIKSQIIEFIKQGEISKNVLDCLSSNGKFIKKESNLWDYKEEVDQDDKCSIAEIIKDIIAFHNTFGGYLIIGIDDDGNFSKKSDINERQLKDLIRNYTTKNIDITCSSIENLIIIYIPKRSISETPITISKLGPEKKNKSIFKPGEIFLRIDDSSSLIRDNADLSFLTSSRSLEAEINNTIINNNLPEKSAIYERFVGRDSYIQKLNRWLLEPFKRYMLLAGPGGVGKTSIAYSFCEDLCIQKPIGIEQVIWISAKQEQFYAINNKSAKLPYNKDSRNYGQYYSNTETLLDAISYHLPILDNEWPAEGVEHKLSVLLQYSGSIKTIFVVDDLDSMDVDDQRNAIDIAMQFNQTQNKFLFTTRKNFLAPSSNTIEVSGLMGNDYQSLVELFKTDFNIPLVKKQIEILERETDGSPLLTESIFRLLRLGDNFYEVIEKWKKKDGEVARSKAFERELIKLTFNAKLVLFAASLSDSLSKSEIKHITELSGTEIDEAYQELEQLFLISIKSIANDPRYSVASTLRKTIRELQDKLLSNHAELTYRYNKLRNETQLKSTRGKDKKVGETIQQAIAQLSAGHPELAEKTVQATLATKNNNSDLWMIYARVLAEIKPININQTRKAFENAYDNGKREQQFFDIWLNFETVHGNSNSAIDVIKKTPNNTSSRNWKWFRMVALSYYRRGSERASRSEYRDAVTDLEKSSKNILKSLNSTPSSFKREIIEISQTINDQLSFCLSKTNVIDFVGKFNIYYSIIKNGEKREIYFIRIIEVVREMKTKGIDIEKKLEIIENEYSNRGFRTENIENLLKNLR